MKILLLRANSSDNESSTSDAVPGIDEDEDENELNKVNQNNTNYNEGMSLILYQIIYHQRIIIYLHHLHQVMRIY